VSRVQRVHTSVTYLEATGRVAALATVANRFVHLALVNVFARFARVVHFVARVANTPIVSNSVFASPVCAHGRILRALVYV